MESMEGLLAGQSPYSWIALTRMNVSFGGREVAQSCEIVELIPNGKWQDPILWGIRTETKSRELKKAILCPIMITDLHYPEPNSPLFNNSCSAPTTLPQLLQPFTHSSAWCVSKLVYF